MKMEVIGMVVVLILLAAIVTSIITSNYLFLLYIPLGCVILVFLCALFKKATTYLRKKYNEIENSALEKNNKKRDAYIQKLLNSRNLSRLYKLLIKSLITRNKYNKCDIEKAILSMGSQEIAEKLIILLNSTNKYEEKRCIIELLTDARPRLYKIEDKLINELYVLDILFGKYVAGNNKENKEFRLVIDLVVKYFINLYTSLTSCTQNDLNNLKRIFDFLEQSNYIKYYKALDLSYYNRTYMYTIDCDILRLYKTFSHVLTKPEFIDTIESKILAKKRIYEMNKNNEEKNYMEAARSEDFIRGIYKKN